MVQTNQMISYLNSSVNVQKHESSKSAKGDEDRNSFSEALGKEISAQEKPAETQESKPEDSQMNGSHVENQIQDTVQQVVIPAISWTVQPQMMQQSIKQQTVNVQISEVQTDAESPVVTIEGKPGEVELNVQTVNVQSVPEAGTGEKAEIVFTENPQMANVKNEKVQQPVHTETAVDAEFPKQVAEPDAVQHEEHHEFVRETVKSGIVQQTADTEILSQNLQTQTASPQAADVVQASKPQTVDMSNMKQGFENLAKTMSEQITQGKTEFEIWLEPANLGKMAVKVAYESGKAVLSIICMSEKTMEIVSQNAKSLGAILQQNTGTDTVVVVEDTPKDYLQQQAQQQGNREGAQQQEQNAKNNEQEAQQQSFLQQLRLGLMQ